MSVRDIFRWRGVIVKSVIARLKSLTEQDLFFSLNCNSMCSCEQTNEFDVTVVQCTTAVVPSKESNAPIAFWKVSRRLERLDRSGWVTVV